MICDRGVNLGLLFQNNFAMFLHGKYLVSQIETCTRRTKRIIVDSFSELCIRFILFSMAIKNYVGESEYLKIKTDRKRTQNKSVAS